MTQINPFTKIPKIILLQRKELCGECNCGVDFNDMCASCPNRKWGSFFCEEGQETANFPDIKEQALNFASAATSEIKAMFNKDQKITKKEKNKRLEICKNCCFFDITSERCKKCGCYLKWKTGWRSQHCPIGKW